MRSLELLAPARNKDIGIAAIDCGADAVYIAGPAFGARHAAGNSLGDIAVLCSHAHRYGARIMLTVNTLVYDDEIEEAHRLMLDAEEAGVDAFIVQDTALMRFPDISVPIHASTQCAIRDVGTARRYESMGCGRIVLERQLPLSAIREIASAVDCEIECFVHGALCVCYSGQCYMSEHIGRRSANRGACMQACRSLYDLADESGRILVKDKALLSLKDLRLRDRMEELAGAGVCSFKIEGRLKGESYVRNIVRSYSMALDKIVETHPGTYRRASWGAVSGGFVPDEGKTFNRGYTELFIDGRRGEWASADSAKSMGEHIGTVASVRRMGNGEMEIRLSGMDKDTRLSNGDGFSFLRGRDTVGFRGDICEGNLVRARFVEGLRKGDRLMRNVSAEFERQLDSSAPSRKIRVRVSMRIMDGDPQRTGGGKAPAGNGEPHSYVISANASSEDGRTASMDWVLDDVAKARQVEKAISGIRSQFSKRHMHYVVSLTELSVLTHDGVVPFVPAARLNAMRRELTEAVDAASVSPIPMYGGCKGGDFHMHGRLTYKSNVANHVARAIALSEGAEEVDDAFEISHIPTAELMRSKYCIKYELGMCPVHQGARPTGELRLLNNGRAFKLGFDCAACEMTVRAADPAVNAVQR